MTILDEFKAFIKRGSVVDLAVGIIIGAAFAKIVTSLVDGILMPPIGWILAGVNFSDLTIHLKRPSGGEPGASLAVGRFLQSIIDFVIIAACVFVVVKAVNKLQGPKEEKPKEAPEDVKLLTEIRDLLKQQGEPKLPVSS